MVGLTPVTFSVLETFASRSGHSFSQCVELALLEHERIEQRELVREANVEKANAILRALNRALNLAGNEVRKHFGSEPATAAAAEHQADVPAPEPLE